MIFDILAYIIIFLSFVYPVYNIYRLLFTKKTYGCANCNSNCALRNVSKLNNKVNVDFKKI